MKIASWNINSLKIRLEQVINWLELTKCDVIALQELKLDNDSFPIESFTSRGYYVAFNGQRTYNGVAIISKHMIEDICYDIPSYLDIQKRVITVTIKNIRMMCIYVVNGESFESEKYNYKLVWLEHLYNYVKSTMSTYSRFVLLGDFNIVPSDIDSYDPTKFDNTKILSSNPERDMWHKLINLGLIDSFRLFNKEPKQYTWWDYRNFAFPKKLGLRIDHILISTKLVVSAINCEIDINPRRNIRPSDHTPIILTLTKI